MQEVLSFLFLPIFRIPRKTKSPTGFLPRGFGFAKAYLFFFMKASMKSARACAPSSGIAL